ncbi:hypothetical protein PtA15_4A405 [Puccinia triticina]|uniref:Beta-trefoil DNA-binding domain-containing protein n=1 Tax=Puccinia triticina TaxID=208348 RepID=A0ABY7CFF5_9BASI|nr:uncharacterized protein PtA15_4A405 [Puccinia triticina]WAQ83954.1 hypothetical protein PtA15_4A405 [Puccinia triticina]
MTDYGVIGAPPVSHLPVPTENNSQENDRHLQLQPTLSHQLSPSYPSPPKSAALTEISNRIKEEDTKNSDHPFQIVSSPSQGTEIHPLDHYSQHPHPHHASHFPIFQEHPNHHTPPTSADLPYHSSTLPSSFHLPHSDPFQPSPTWSHSPQVDFHQPHLSLSTPISAKGLSSADSTRSFPLSRLLTIPYQLDSPDSKLDGYQLSPGFGLPSLDGAYNEFNGHHPVSQPHRFGSQLKGLHQIPPIDHHPPSAPADYAPRSPPARQNHPFHLPSRLPSTPSDSFPFLLPSHLAQPAPEAQAGQKRKYEPDCFSEPFSPKLQRPSPVPIQPSRVSLNTVGLESGHERMTTILCLHASVAQKSYGQEKRFLCPPPLVRITGPYRQLPKSYRPILSMSILNENGQRHLCQTALLGEDESNVHFKSLHISGAAKKAKHVNLELSLHPPILHDPKPLPNVGPEMDELMPPFATFRSSDCTIISKPSKKTAKARNTQSCIFNGSTICLFNRINSQTVRTKYLCVQDGQLAARAAQWSAFTIRVLRRAEEAGADGTPPITAKTLLSSSIPGADRTVTYGSEVELIDFVTGVSSGPLIVRKVEKNMVQKDATGPVSQMQKLAFCLLDKPSGSALYISALEGVPLSASSPPTVPTPASEMNANPDGTDLSGLPLGPPLGYTSAPAPQTTRMLHMLQLQPPRATLPSEDPNGIPFDEIDDSVAWTVIGVAHFSHSFIDLSHYYPQIPQLPITPFPALTARPQVDLHALTMTLRVTGFFDAHARAMEIWLGPIGALETKVSATSGLTLEPSIGDGGANENSGSNGLRLQVSSDASNGWSSHRKGARRESTLLVTLPPLESVYWTLHRKNMPSRSVIVLDESNRSMSELVGRNGDGAARNENGHLNHSNHIPALPITLIRADGISYVMGHSICLCEVNHDEHKENEDISKASPDEPDRSHTFILKVI